MIQARGVSKRYAVPVLRAVDFDVGAGEVHALVGSNGAGKTTLARILAGVVKADAGRLQLGGESYRPIDQAAAEAAGVHIVHQELSLVSALSVAENLFLNRLPHRFGWIDFERLHRDARQAMRAVGLGHLDPGHELSTLGVGELQLIAIAAVLSLDCRVLILDEPTAALTDPQVQILFDHVRRWKERGIAIIYISHRFEELHDIADRITVLRDGRVVACLPAVESDSKELLRLMTGTTMESARPTTRRRTAGDIAAGDIALRVESLYAGRRVHDVSFEVRRGEILGFAGLVGSGRTDVLRAVFGADRRSSGEIFGAETAAPLTILEPRDSTRLGIGLVAEDRRADGLLLDRSVRGNLSLAALGKVSRLGWLDRAAERRTVEDLTATLGIQLASVEQPVRELSGGNQQKVLIARWYLADCDVLFLDEPTRGIDVGARRAIYGVLDALTAEGRALVVVSSDLQELVEISDRILVFREGRVVGAFEGPSVTYEAVSAACIAGVVQ